MTIDEDINNNLIKVYYEKNNSSSGGGTGLIEYVSEYTIKYYYNDIIDNSRTETIMADKYEKIDEEKISENINQNKKSGYVVSNIENIPLTVSNNPNNNEIRVYYVEAENLEREYKVEYYFDGILDENSTEIINANKGDVIESVNDKIIRGYELDKTENLPLTVSDEDNIIKVYYKKAEYNYQINYYYDNIKDDSKTENLKAKYEAKITDYPEKTDNRYTLSEVRNIPLIISDDESLNIVDIYYVSKKSIIEVKYIDKISNEEIAESMIIQGKVGETVQRESILKDIKDYVLMSEIPENIEFTENDQILYINYGYKSKGVLEQHIDFENNEIIFEETHNGLEKDIYEILPLDNSEYKEYKLREDMLPENAKGEMAKELITVKYYYDRVKDESDEEDPKENDPKENDPKEEEPKDNDPKENDPKEEEPKDNNPKEEPKDNKPNEDGSKDNDSKENKPNENSQKDNNSNNSVQKNSILDNNSVQNKNEITNNYLKDNSVTSSDTKNSYDSKAVQNNKSNTNTNTNTNTTNNNINNTNSESNSTAKKEVTDGLNTGDTTVIKSIITLLAVLVINALQIIITRIVKKKKVIK